MNRAPVPVPESHLLALTRPHPDLWIYYVISALLTGPGIVLVLPYLYFRYRTLCYRFDSEGIHMRVGILFRREVNLTYTRIQDIHLRAGVLQRWLGLATLEIQTASGSASAELVIEGFKEFEAIRDFLYTRMRGVRAQSFPNTPRPALSGAGTEHGPEAISLLLSIRDELRLTRQLLETANPSSSPSTTNPLRHG